MGFADVIREHEEERHWRILSRPRGWRPASDDGFMSPVDAARVMGVSAVELADLVRHGVLEWRDAGGEIVVRPAVVRVSLAQQPATRRPDS